MKDSAIAMTVLGLPEPSTSITSVGSMYQPNEHEWALSRGVLFEIRAGLEAMHDKPQRIAYRDFSLWPVAPLAVETDTDRAAFKRTQKQQLDHMWDQSQP
jgi:hydroxyacylglutathione hydrolase